jgi:hypothetical protein
LRLWTTTEKSHVWDEQFRSDKVARNAAITAIESEGALTFMRDDNGIPFPKAQEAVKIRTRQSV